MQNLFSIIEKQKNLNKPALVEDGKSISYKELYLYINGFSTFLANKGINSGDRIGIYMPNSIEFAIAFFACLNVGAIAVPINTIFRKNEIEYYINDSNPKIVLSSYTHKEYLLQLDCKAAEAIISVKGNLCDADIFEKRYDFNNPNEATTADSIAIHLYSTGSTGNPKRVSRTHISLIRLAENHSETVGWDSSEKILFSLPISHTYALGNFLASINSGMTCYLLEDFNRRKVTEITRNHKITIYPAVPFILKILCESNIDKDAFSSLKLLISAGAPLPRDTFIKFRDRFGISPRQLYGSSETGVISINLDHDIDSSCESVGKTVKEVIVKIIKDDNQEAGINELGEIVVKSPTMTKGYDNLPEETGKVFKNGYYYTGDIGFIDEKGNIYIKGRKKLLINISGNKVDPVEIEELLNSHPDIIESAVTGYINQSGNESIRTYIVTRDKLNKLEIIDYLKNRVAGFKIPDSIIFVDKISKSPTGKILRESLNEHHGQQTGK